MTNANNGSRPITFRGDFKWVDPQGDSENGQRTAMELTEEALQINAPLGHGLRIPYRDISSMHSEEYAIRLTLGDDATVTLHRLGYGFDGMWKELQRRRNECIIQDGLMFERPVYREVPVHFRWDDNAGEGALRLYETGFIFMPELGDPLRIPYSFIDRIEAADFSIAIHTEHRGVLTLERLGRQYEMLVRQFTDVLNTLLQQTQQVIERLDPSLSTTALRRLSRLLRDGRAASQSDIEAVTPEFWAAMEQWLAQYDSFDDYDFLRSFQHHGSLHMGMKRGLLGDETGDYLWFLIPIMGDSRGGNALAMEAAGPDQSGRATYFFRIVPRSRFADLSPEEYEYAIDRAVNHLNRCLLAVNFRREPIYLADERLREEAYLHYRRAVRVLPELRDLRQAFIGRVIHRSPEQWQRDVEDLLFFHTQSTEDTLRWKRGDRS